VGVPVTARYSPRDVQGEVDVQADAKDRAKQCARDQPADGGPVRTSDCTRADIKHAPRRGQDHEVSTKGVLHDFA
jgi:hypothetical protein